MPLGDRCHRILEEALGPLDLRRLLLLRRCHICDVEFFPWRRQEWVGPCFGGDATPVSVRAMGGVLPILTKLVVGKPKLLGPEVLLHSIIVAPQILRNVEAVLNLFDLGFDGSLAMGNPARNTNPDLLLGGNLAL